jgi:hypothetical protein
MNAQTAENDADEMVRLLEPHWRTDCSHADAHAYVRWVKCRCGWESRRSSSLVNAPDLHRIWIKHQVDALTGVTPPASDGAS